MKPLLLLLWLGLILSVPSHAAGTATTTPPAEPAPLVVWNREIAVFRAQIGNFTPVQRRDDTLIRLANVSDLLLYQPIHAAPASFGSIKGTSFLLGDQMLFALIESDLNLAAGETMDSVSKTALARLEELREAKLTQRRLPVILRGIAVVVASTLAFLALVWVLRWLGRKIRRFVLQRTAKFKQLKVNDFNFRPIMFQGFRRVVGLLGWLIGLCGAYVWIGTVLAPFPYTAPWGRILGEQVRHLIADMFGGLVEALPGIAVVIIIFVITRWVARLVNHVFRHLEQSHDHDSWLGHDIARATRRIVVAAVWIFGLTLAYPYIPGSESTAFKGVSVLVGLMISLGSTGLVNQVMSGFVVLYSGAVRSGEYARVGDTEGTIQEIGLLSTKVLTSRREYVTVPNAVLIAKETINYSRIQENEQRTELSTAVTIGYDTPWRQVHAMLLLAASHTPGVRKQPAPRVVQTALSDFYAEYELRFVAADVALKATLLSELHQRIQDVFNEFEVQIMSPNFVAQPANNVLSPKDQWFAAPAKIPEPRRDPDTGT